MAIHCMNNDECMIYSASTAMQKDVLLAGGTGVVGRMVLRGLVEGGARRVYVLLRGSPHTVEERFRTVCDADVFDGMRDSMRAVCVPIAGDTTVRGWGLAHVPHVDVVVHVAVTGELGVRYEDLYMQNAWSVRCMIEVLEAMDRRVHTVFLSSAYVSCPSDMRPRAAQHAYAGGAQPGEPAFVQTLRVAEYTLHEYCARRGSPLTIVRASLPGAPVSFAMRHANRARPRANIAGRVAADVSVAAAATRTINFVPCDVIARAVCGVVAADSVDVVPRIEHCVGYGVRASVFAEACRAAHMQYFGAMSASKSDAMNKIGDVQYFLRASHQFMHTLSSDVYVHKKKSFLHVPHDEYLHQNVVWLLGQHYGSPASDVCVFEAAAGDARVWWPRRLVAGALARFIRAALWYTPIRSVLSADVRDAPLPPPTTRVWRVRVSSDGPVWCMLHVALLACYVLISGGRVPVIVPQVPRVLRDVRNTVVRLASKYGFAPLTIVRSDDNYSDPGAFVCVRGGACGRLSIVTGDT